MKRILFCFIFLIAFAGISSGIMLVNGYDKNSVVMKTEVDTYMDLSNDEKLSNEENIINNVSNLYVTDIVYNVVLFEFSDYKNYYSQTKIDNFNSLFNDNDNSNNIYSVHEYFQDLSYGKVSIYANIYLHKDNKPKSFYDVNNYTLTLEYATYSKALITSETCYSNYSSDKKGAMIVFSSEIPDSNKSRFWAHAYKESSFLSMTYDAAKVTTICHEILHNFNLGDHYVSDSKTLQPIETWDLMSQTWYGPINTLMYNKKNLDWVSISDYEDGNTTQIETITKSGTYTLYPTTYQGGGTLAYKFGIKENNQNVYFMVEYRKKEKFGIDSGITGTGLIIYRVNENYKFEGNLDKNFENFETFVFRVSNEKTSTQTLNCKYSYYDSSYYEIGSLTKKAYALYYEDNTICKCSISNIIINSDGTATFDFNTYQNKNIVSGQVTNGINGIKADIYVDGLFVKSTDNNGRFLLENINNTNIVSFIDTKGYYTFNPIFVQPNTLYMSVYPYSDDITIKIKISGKNQNQEYYLYKFVNNKYEFDDSFYANEIKTKKLTYGNIFKITGNDIDDYEFIVTHNESIILTQNYTIAQKSEKSLLDRIGDHFSNFTDSVGGFVGDTVDYITQIPDMLVDGFNNAVDEISRLFNL